MFIKKTKPIDEYDVTFAVKEWLLKHKWDVVAFNPPGAQGTFTIPNPAKDPQYKGQRGSEAPDIIAVKQAKYALMMESKPRYNQKDADKLLNLYKNKERRDLAIRLIEKVCAANEVPFKKPVKLILAKAHGGQNNLRMDMQTFLVSVNDKWSPEKIDPTIDPFKYMKVIFKESDRVVGEIIRDP